MNEIEKLAMDKLKSKWEHLYTFGYPQKPYPTSYANDLANVILGYTEALKDKKEEIRTAMYKAHGYRYMNSITIDEFIDAHLNTLPKH